ncbi:MAG: hypothetical protein QOD94_2170, partial [Alphaproteobacteria bacterium]|nr:hypothetical protein [Alphaproteobacteria bacterium]
MRSARTWVMVGSVMLAASAANAADMPVPQPLPPVEIGAWYLRGDIGFTNQKVDKVENKLIDRADRVQVINSDFDSAGLFGLGVGYQLNNWLRVDVTGEYRMNSSYNGLDVLSF